MSALVSLIPNQLHKKPALWWHWLLWPLQHILPWTHKHTPWLCLQQFLAGSALECLHWAGPKMHRPLGCAEGQELSSKIVPTSSHLQKSEFSPTCPPTQPSKAKVVHGFQLPLQQKGLNFYHLGKEGLWVPVSGPLSSSFFIHVPCVAFPSNHFTGEITLSTYLISKMVGRKRVAQRHMID